MAKGPLGNSPRDLRDDFVGVEAPSYKGGEAPKKTRNPKKVTSNTFHTSVTGATSNKRPDRAGHFRSGGFVRGKADGGIIDDARMAPMPQIGEAKGKMAPMPQVGPAEGKMAPMPYVKPRGPSIPRTDADREQIWGLNRKKGGKV